MKIFNFYRIIFLILPVALLPCQNVFSQNNPNWQLNQASYISYQWANYAHAMAVKAKYTSKGFKSVLYNFIPFYDSKPDLPDNNQFEPNDYIKWYGSNGMRILRDTIGSQGIYTDQHHLHGSTSNYAKDYETDENENFILIADNRGNGWKHGQPVTSKLSDSTQLLLCKFKTTSIANTEVYWHRVYGGSSAEYAIAIKKTMDGNFIVLAQTQSNDGDITGYHGGKDIWILKISNADGAIIWKKTIGTLKDEIPTDLEILPDESIVISGTAESSNLFPSPYPGLNSFLLKLDGAGAIQWSKVFGGPGNDKINAFVSTNGDGYVSISSSSSSDGDYPANFGGSDIYITRHNTTGDILWSRHYGSNEDDIAGDIAFNNCDSMIYASFSKNAGGGYQLPRFSRSQGIRIRLESSGNQVYYFEEIFRSGSTLSEYVTPSIVSNNKGGILSLNNKHSLWTGERDKVSRSFNVVEYGISPKRNNVDTTVCKGQQAWGKKFYTDTSYADTLRNSCRIDTLVTIYNVHIANADLLITRDTMLCYGTYYKDRPVYTSFSDADTTVMATACGPKSVIIKTNVKVTPRIINSFGEDSLICPQQKITLTTHSPATAHLWQDGSTKPEYIASGPGIYWVEVTDIFGCKSRDSIRLQTEPGKPVRRISLDTAICKGQQAWGILFYKDSSFSDTLRNNCQLDTLIKRYTVQILNADLLIVKDTTLCYGAIYENIPVYSSFVDRDSTIVAAVCGNKLISTITNVAVSDPIINLFGRDTVICRHQTIRLQAYSPASNYLWYDGSMLASKSASDPGKYWVEVTDYFGCKSRDTITIAPSDLYLNVSPDTIITNGSSVILSPATNGRVTWDFNPSLSCTICPTAKASPLSSTTYYLKTEKENCVLTGQVKIVVNDHFYMYIPNAFTPNNDGINDQLKVITNITGVFTIDIFNRNGEKVFSSGSASRVWDGTFKGVRQPAGNYVYAVSYRYGNSELKFKKGNLLLLR